MFNWNDSCAPLLFPVLSVFFLLSLSMSFSLFLSVSLFSVLLSGLLVMSLSTHSVRPPSSSLLSSIAPCFFFSWSVRASGWLLTCLVLMEYCLRRRQRSCCGWEWWMSFTLSDQAKSPKLMIDSSLKSCFWLFMYFLSNREVSGSWDFTVDGKWHCSNLPAHYKYTSHIIWTSTIQKLEVSKILF